MIQLVKRSPLDLRPALGIAAELDAASLGHALSAYARMQILSAEQRAARIGWCIDRLERLRSRSFDRPCWGYHFDVQTRFFPYGREIPNTIATSFAALGLLDAYEQTAEERALDLAVGAARFLVEEMGPRRNGEGEYFGYLPSDRTPVHNANLLAASLVARAGRAVGDEQLLEQAATGLGYTVAHQRSDGAWRYSEDGIGDWVDGLHTGYVLDALQRCAAQLGAPEAATAWRRGLRLYADHLIEAGGRPRYYLERPLPVESQNAAQAIQTLAAASAVEPARIELAWSCFDYACEHLRRPDGAFIYLRGRRIANRTPHVRWVQAPMLDALTRLALADSRSTGVTR